MVCEVDMVTHYDNPISATDIKFKGSQVSKCSVLKLLQTLRVSSFADCLKNV